MTFLHTPFVQPRILFPPHPCIAFLPISKSPATSTSCPRSAISYISLSHSCSPPLVCCALHRCARAHETHACSSQVSEPASWLYSIHLSCTHVYIVVTLRRASAPVSARARCSFASRPKHLFVISIHKKNTLYSVRPVRIYPSLFLTLPCPLTTAPPRFSRSTRQYRSM